VKIHNKRRLQDKVLPPIIIPKSSIHHQQVSSLDNSQENSGQGSVMMPMIKPKLSKFRPPPHKPYLPIEPNTSKVQHPFDKILDENSPLPPSSAKSNDDGTDMPYIRFLKRVKANKNKASKDKAEEELDNQILNFEFNL
jgi:hypothetical protein